MENLSIILTFLFFALGTVGFFCTKKPGFGKYTTSLFLLILVLFVVAIALVSGKTEWQSLVNLLFAIAGYAGGLVTPKEEKEEKGANGP